MKLLCGECRKELGETEPLGDETEHFSYCKTCLHDVLQEIDQTQDFSYVMGL